MACLLVAGLTTVLASPVPQGRAPVVHVSELMTMSPAHITAELSKRGSVPHDLNQPSTIVARTARQEAPRVGAPPWHRPTGTYVGRCMPITLDFGEGTVSYPVKGSVLEVVDYKNQGKNLDLDVTIYVGDDTCLPSKADTLAKYLLHYNAKYLGPTDVPRNAGGTKITWSYRSEGSFYFGYPEEGGAVTQKLFEKLNQECPCGMPGGWTPKVTRTVDAKMCSKNAYPHNNASTADLCNAIAGNPLFFTMKWADTNDHYVISRGLYSEQSPSGYMEPIDNSAVFTLIPESGNQDPAQCDYLTSAQCDPSIDKAREMCDSCGVPGGDPGQSLECEACLYDQFPQKLDPEKSWDVCCPCFYWEAEHYGVPWLQVDC